jgi:folylpolyglutamate synthase/dihydropteroate synthase
MKDQHRATAEQWLAMEVDGRNFAVASCLLELRDRIKALEATQHAHVDLSHLSDAEREKMLKSIASPGRFEVLEVAQPPQPNHPEFPDGSLVKRVANAMDGATEWQARAAIREVAAWLREENGYGPGWAIRLEQEAER